MEKFDKITYWTPRILSLMLVLFLMMFSLDVFEPGLSVWEIVIGLFMHNIPALILLVVAIISWKREIIGGIIFILAGIAYIVTRLATGQFESEMLLSFLIISGPAFLIGILFTLGWVKKRKIL